MNMQKTVSVTTSLDHMLLAWHVLSSKFSDLRADETLSEQERRAIWHLEDILETELAQHIAGLPETEWQALILESKRHMASVQVQFGD